MNKISVLTTDKNFLKRLLTFRSYDKVQVAFAKKGIELSMEQIDKIKNIVYDLEDNEDIISKEDLDTIYNAGVELDFNGYFNQKLYDFFYSSKNKYGEDFFMNKDIYDGATISTGIFTIACLIYKAKKMYLKTRSLWEIVN